MVHQRACGAASLVRSLEDSLAHHSNVPNRFRRRIGLADDSNVSLEAYARGSVANRLPADDMPLGEADRGSA